MMIRDSFFVDGRWARPGGSRTIDVVSPVSEKVIGRIGAGTPEDADAAVQAARRALDGWAAVPPEQRAEYLEKMHQGLVARAEEIARTVTDEIGMPLKLSQRIQAGLPAAVMASYAALAREFPFSEKIGNSLVLREPVGVAVCITPWNYPLHQAVAKIAPALAAGCTVVLKPSELAPFTAFILAEIAEAAGLPPGVFNLVTGYGPEIGEALVEHPETDLVSFTGSTRAGRRVAELAARGVKRVSLELGGKSPAVLLDDADLPRAVKATVGSCFVNSGQTCNAQSRMLVPRDLHQEAARLAVEAASAFTPGDPHNPGTRLGPLVSGKQRERAWELIRQGMAEGAELLCGGPEPPPDFASGFFIRPTVFGRVDSRMSIAQEEIFAPVLCILPYDSEEEAVRIANDTRYGLGGGVWSQDPARALRVARRIRAGQVEINGAPFNVLAPFGGHKQSGYGRELGRYGLEEFLEVKSIQLGE